MPFCLIFAHQSAYRVMKKSFCVIVCACWLTVGYGCSQKQEQQELTLKQEQIQESEDMNVRKPIKANTTKIVYSTHTNSGVAVAITYEITRDSVTWDYHDYREGHHLRDMVAIDAADYDALVASLSQVSFSAKDMHDASSGGSGYGCSFMKDKDTYFRFNNTYKLKGDYESVLTAITSFLENHPTAGDTQCKRCLEKSNDDKFYRLPQEMEKYRVGK